MQHPIHHPHSPFRIFAVSAVATVTALATMLFTKGPKPMLIALVLILVEVAFSFDNAILNARVLRKMSPFWQRMFLTVGALIAVFGMRLVFPIMIVAITAGLGWGQVVQLALHQPDVYAQQLHAAHISIASFGGAFLLILALDFFIDETTQVMWFTRLERELKKLAKHWTPPLITLAVVAGIGLLPANHHSRQTVIAGVLGVVVYSVIHGLTELLGRVQGRSLTTQLTGTAAFMAFMYLEVLDASFSFDGVIGAFAITGEVVLIAIGLGIGALWVRSLTVFLVRRGTIDRYRYIVHGAHYTIFVLAAVLLVSIIYDVPEFIPGVTGLGIIGASILASRQALRAPKP